MRGQCSRQACIRNRSAGSRWWRETSTCSGLPPEVASHMCTEQGSRLLFTTLGATSEKKCCILLVQERTRSSNELDPAGDVCTGYGHRVHARWFMGSLFCSKDIAHFESILAKPGNYKIKIWVCFIEFLSKFVINFFSTIYFLL